DGCTLSDTCGRDGGCSGSLDPCLTPPGPCFADAGQCVAGACAYAAAPGRTCSDANACTTNDVCLADAGCEGSTAVSCVTPDDGGCFSPAGTCDPQTGTCTHTPRSGACDDQRPCTMNDTCSGQGLCEGTAYTCTTPPECQMGSGSCNGDKGCTYP